MAPSFHPSGVLTLTTDFGHKGPFVATMKGMMLKTFANARLVDLTHETVAHFPAEAGFWLHRSYQFFPEGTVHVAVVDPGVGTERDILTVVSDGHAFLAPDNGLLAPIFEGGNAVAFKVDIARLSDLGIGASSITFEGRDIFAPLGAKLASGAVAPESLGPAIDEIIPSWVDEPTVSPGQVAGTVITVDNFGNLITNIGAELLERFAAPVVRAGGHSFDLNRTYGSVTPGTYLALINSFGVVEIARAEQSAADGLGLERGAPVRVLERH